MSEKIIEEKPIEQSLATETKDEAEKSKKSENKINLKTEVKKEDLKKEKK